MGAEGPVSAEFRRFEVVLAMFDDQEILSLREGSCVEHAVELHYAPIE